MKMANLDAVVGYVLFGCLKLTSCTTHPVLHEFYLCFFLQFDFIFTEPKTEEGVSVMYIPFYTFIRNETFFGSNSVAVVGFKRVVVLRRRLCWSWWIYRVHFMAEKVGVKRLRVYSQGL